MQPHIFILSNIFLSCKANKIDYLEIFGIHEASALCVEQTKKETTYYTLKKNKRRLRYGIHTSGTLPSYKYFRTTGCSIIIPNNNIILKLKVMTDWALKTLNFGRLAAVKSKFSYLNASFTSAFWSSVRSD
jgi:hypothetical protein